MSDRIFVDSNIFIYAHTDLDLQKQSIAQELLRSKTIFITTQVINEFINASRKKFYKDWKEITKVVEEIISYTSVETISLITVKKAIELAALYRYSYYDSMIVASALETNCPILYSEDLQDGQKINKTLKIINPF